MIPLSKLNGEEFILNCDLIEMIMENPDTTILPVSYTHLDVYKRQGLKRSVLVVATSNQSAMMRSKCTMTATTIAEYFKDQGMRCV